MQIFLLFMVKNKIIQLLSIFRRWRLSNLNEQYYLLIISLLVGIFAGLASYLMKASANLVKVNLLKIVGFEYFNLLFFIFPLIGIFIVILIMRFGIRQVFRHGIVTTLYAIAKEKSILGIKTVFGPLITAAITVAFGGSAGVEGPAVASGSAVGSQIAQKFRLNHKHTSLMLACGATGAMAGSLNAPIAGLIFTLEVLMLDLTAYSILPLLVASIGGVLVGKVLFGGDYLINVQLSENFEISDIPFFILLGLLTGLGSVYFNRMFWYIETIFKRIRNYWYRFAIAGAILGVMIFCIPVLYGEGYHTINQILSGNYQEIFSNTPFFNSTDNLWIFFLLVIGLTFFKVIATTLTIVAGGVGGVVAPSLFTGASLGFFTAMILNTFTVFDVNVVQFTLLGMAGVFAGILFAPLTAIFLIAELTGGYTLVVPLMVVVIISYLMVKIYVKHSIYTRQLAERKQLLTHNKDQVILHYMNIQEILENDFVIIGPKASLGEIVKAIQLSKRNIFPVVDEKEQLKGVLFMDNIRHIIFNESLYQKVRAEQLMTQITTYIDIKDYMETVMEKFSTSQAWNLPVLNEGKYVGFLSRSAVYSRYREIMVKFSDE